MPDIGSFLSALSGAFGGYAQDEEARKKFALAQAEAERQQRAQAMQEQVSEASLAEHRFSLEQAKRAQQEKDRRLGLRMGPIGQAAYEGAVAHDPKAMQNYLQMLEPDDRDVFLKTAGYISPEQEHKNRLEEIRAGTVARADAREPNYVWVNQRQPDGSMKQVRMLDTSGLESDVQPPAGQRGAAQVKNSMALARAARDQLDKAIAHVQNNVSAFGGLLRSATGAISAQPGLIGGVTKWGKTQAEQRFAREDQPARQRVAAIVNESLHRLSGAAVTAQEWERLKSSTPDIDQDDYQTITQKLSQMREQIDNILSRQEQEFGGGGGGGGGGGAPPRAPGAGGSSMQDLVHEFEQGSWRNP